LRLLIHSTVSDAARKLSVSEETIDGLLDRWIGRTVDWGPWERLGVMGMDEIALKRGHRDFVVWVTTPLAGATCAIQAWCTRVRASGLPECKSCLGMLDRWMDEMTNYVQNRQTSGCVEDSTTA
jgi:hypothetical protein